MNLYAHLFHGRKSPGEDLDDWGFDGPLIGPLTAINWTYGWLKLFDGSDIVHLPHEHDLIVVDGNYYGDVAFLTEEHVKEHPANITPISLTDLKKLIECDQQTTTSLNTATESTNTTKPSSEA